VPGAMLAELQGAWSDVGLGEAGYRIAVGLKEEKDALAVRDPASAETHAHASTQRFGIQEPARQRFGNEEPTGESGPCGQESPIASLQ
jgi:hypothetical protein